MLCHRPLVFLFILGVSGFVTVKLFLMDEQNARAATMVSYAVMNKTLSEIEMTSRLLPHFNASTISFARSLSLLLNGTELSYSAIQTQIAPRLFLAFSTIPYISQVSYIGTDGLLFSYYLDKDQTLAVFSNSSVSSNWYKMLVDRETGMLYGDAVVLKSMVSANTSWFKEALASANAYSALITGWSEDQDQLFLSVVAVDGRGVVSFGFPAKLIVDHFAALDFHRGGFLLATPDNQVIVQSEVQETQLVIRDGILNVHTKGDPDVGTALCFDSDWKLRSLNWKIMGIRYFFYCSNIDIAGIQMVYVLAYQLNGFLNLVQHNSVLSLFVLVLHFLLVLISLGAFIFFIVRAAKREMLLCASLVNQTQATQQAERKSMNKTNVLAKTNHDVRQRLAEIVGLVELCTEDESSLHEIKSHLGKMKSCTKDMLDILNSVLDMSKIEAGKMEVKEEQFNLAQLLEDVVDRYYTVGMKKGVDMLLDPCDGSILRLLLVKGDPGKLKQILLNLLSNAMKFTSEGHVTVRTVVKRKSVEQDIIASNRNSVLKDLFSCLCYKNEKDLKEDLDALDKEQNPNCLDIEFEVDDTGIGIAKDKQASVFEDFVQVKGAARELEGCGLGLGIVQSMVRIMGGEIRIVEKPAGENGTCFRFNVQLTVCEPADAADSDWSTHQRFAFFRNPMPKPEGSSHVVLFIAGDERRKVLRRYLESLNIRVTVVRRTKCLKLELDRLKRKLDPNNCLRDSAKLERSSSAYSCPAAIGASLSKKEGKNEEISPQFMKCSQRTLSPGVFTLVVIDSTAGNYYDLCLTAADFKRDVPNFVCKLVWLDNPINHSSSSKASKGPRKAPPCDLIVNNPLHGSRLIQVIQLLSEYKGMSGRNFTSLSVGEAAEGKLQNTDANVVMESTACMGSDTGLEEIVVLKDDVKRKEEEEGLKGKKILVVEDVELLRNLASKLLSKLGAQAEECKNGKEAVDRVCNLLSRRKQEGDSEEGLPYDYIFMDCEMPVMDGYEATRLIRIEEEKYGVHIPIIALTAHAMSDEASKTILAGMDAHLTKPLQMQEVLCLMRSTNNNV